MEAAVPTDFIRDEFSCKPNFDEAMARIEALFKDELIDRTPIRFSGHNAEFDFSDGSTWTPERWKAHRFDFDAVVERTVREMESAR